MLAFVSHFSREYVEYDSFAALRNANCAYYRPVSSYRNLFILSFGISPVLHVVAFQCNL